MKRSIIALPLLLLLPNTRCVHAQDKPLDAIDANVLFRDDPPRDLGVVSPGKSLSVRIPILNNLPRDLFLSESSSSCLSTSVVPLKKIFSTNSENHVELVIKAGIEEDIKQVTVNLKFRESEVDNAAILAVADIVLQLRVASECSLSSHQVLFETKTENVDLFATNYGRFKWSSIRCDTGNLNITAKCFIKDGVEVDGEQRQVARVQLTLVGFPEGEGVNEKVQLHMFAQPFSKQTALIEVGTFAVDVIRHKRIEITPKVLHLNQSEDLAFFVISNDESFSIAEKELELIVQPTGTRINSKIKRISPRWVRVVVAKSEFSDFIGNSDKLRLHVHSQGDKVSLTSAELMVR